MNVQVCTSKEKQILNVLRQNKLKKRQNNRRPT